MPTDLVTQELAALRQEVQALREMVRAIDFAPRSNPQWFEPIASEPNVQLHIRDLARPGQVLFDVGANIGQITEVMSDVVGPKGVVVAFEANPATLPPLSANIFKNCRFNTHLMFAAVMHTSKGWFGIEDHGAASVVVPGQADAAIPALALDDFVRDYGLVPALVKFDIEGNEANAFKGFASTIETHRPHIIFEHNIGHDAPIDILRAAGYETFCCSQHTAIRSSGDCLANASQRNIVAIHRAKLADTRFGRRIIRTDHATLQGDAFAAVPPHETGCVRKLQLRLRLDAGRYLLTLNADASQSSTLFFCMRARGVIRQHWTSAAHFLRNERDMAVDLPQADMVSLEIGELADRPTLQLASVSVERIGFS